MALAWPRCRGSSSPRCERSTQNTAAPPSSALPDSALDPLLHPAPTPRSLQERESTVNVIDVILAKRDGRELTDPQIDWVIRAYTAGSVADEQMSALAMAILLNGMSRREINRWTDAMIGTGIRMDFSGLDR